tara:strand:+ start:6744 stop:10043 length:3300 start_codon:yes stop_codon:yes gene_type:complete
LLLPISFAFSNVTVTIGDADVSGYTSDIVVPVSIENPVNTVGGLQFDILSTPDLLLLSSVSAIDADNFSADYNVLDDGSARVVFYSNNGSGIAAGGNGTVINLHYNGSDILSAFFELEGYALTVSDEDGAIIGGQINSGSLTIGDVVTMSATSDTGDISEEVMIDIHLGNSGLVGGLQFDIADSPNYIDVIGLTTTERSTGFNIDFNELANGLTRVIMYNAENSNIEIGTGPIARLQMVIHENAYNSNVGINFENVTITDAIGGSYFIESIDSGTVTVSPGYIEEPHNLQAQDGMDAEVLLSWDAPYGPIPQEFEEDFEEGSVPEGWVATTNSAQGWFITQDGSSDFWSIPSHSWYMCSNDDMANDDGSADYLILPPLNVSGADNISLNFASYYDGSYSQTAHIAVSTDGTNFTEVSTLNAASEWVMESVDLSEYGGAANLYIAFHANDNGAWASGWAVDDVLVSFAVLNTQRALHYNLTELGQWAVSAPKEDVLLEFGGGIPLGQKFDLENPIFTTERPVDIDAYKIYKSLSSNSDFEEIAEVNGDVTTYSDDDVVNSTTYYYKVTAIYPDGSESGATNTVSATPVEWVELSMDNGSSLSGQMDTIDFYINNETELGLFYFEIMDYPNVMNGLNILPTERTSSWALEIADQGDGTIAITGISIGDPLLPGDGAVCRAVLYPVAEEEMTVNLSFTSGTAIQDVGYVDLNWTADGAIYTVGIETQFLSLYGGYALPGEQTTGSVFMETTQPVYALEFDIIADPPFLTGVNLDFSQLIDLDNWSVSGSDIGIGYRITAFDNSGSNPINPGIRHLADVDYSVFNDIPEGTIVDITVSDPVIADVNNLPMVTQSTPHSFYIGQPPAGCTIENASGQLTPGGTGVFEIHMENTETINILEFEIMDMPNNMVITNVTPLGRFDDGTIDGGTGETEEGNFYFLGYDFASAIEPGEGAILEVEVEFTENLDNSSIIFMISSISAGDVNAVPVTIIADDFGQFSGYLNTFVEGSLPKEFTLHSNYPNPFNPSTVISYDLSRETAVKLNVYDMKGRRINALVNQVQSAGRHHVRWNAKDARGNGISAGVYLYRLEAGGKVFTEKMIFMK